MEHVTTLKELTDQDTGNGVAVLMALCYCGWDVDQMVDDPSLAKAHRHKHKCPYRIALKAFRAELPRE